MCENGAQLLLLAAVAFPIPQFLHAIRSHLKDSAQHKPSYFV